MKKLLGAFLAALLAITAVQTVPIAYAAVTQRFVQTPTITLYASISSSATSIRITPYPKDLSSTKLTMNDFGSSTSATIDPKVKGVEEIITFTGITDNGDNTATLTGVTRGMLSKYPYTSGGTAYAHSASAIIVFSNNPQVYSRLASLENDQTWTGINTYNTRPKFASDTDSSNATDFVTVGQMSRQAISGASNASLSVKGIFQVPTALQIASSTPAGSTGALLALTSTSSTSTPSSLCGLGCIPATQNNGKLSQSFLDLTQSYSWTGAHTFTSSATFNGSATFNIVPTFGSFSATSTTATSSVSGNFTVAKNASTTNMWVSGTCTNCTENGRSVVTNTGTGPSTINGTAAVSVSCSGSQIVQTGGGTIATPSNGCGLYQSYPSATTTWTIGYVGTQNAACGTMTVYAICVNP